MVKDNAIPLIKINDSISNAIVEMNSKRLGFVVVLDEQNKLFGIFTDGDLRRTLEKKIDFANTPIKDYTHQKCFTVLPDELATESLKIMKKNKINSLIVVNQEHDVIGCFNIHRIIDLNIN